MARHHDEPVAVRSAELIGEFMARARWRRFSHRVRASRCQLKLAAACCPRRRYVRKGPTKCARHSLVPPRRLNLWGLCHDTPRGTDRLVACGDGRSGAGGGRTGASWPAGASFTVAGRPAGDCAGCQPVDRDTGAAGSAATVAAQTAGTAGAALTAARARVDEACSLRAIAGPSERAASPGSRVAVDSTVTPGSTVGGGHVRVGHGRTC